MSNKIKELLSAIYSNSIPKIENLLNESLNINEQNE